MFLYDLQIATLENFIPSTYYNMKPVCVKLTSTMPWLMVPYCRFLSRTRLITITVAIATVITSKPIRVPFPKVNSSPKGWNISWFPLRLNC